MNNIIKTHGALDCCKDKDCDICKGTGYILPLDVFERELRYCSKCNQMTNHELFKLPLSANWECLKCKTRKDGER